MPLPRHIYDDSFVSWVGFGHGESLRELGGRTTSTEMQSQPPVQEKFVPVIRFRILGPVQFEVSGQTSEPAGPKLRQVMSLLLLRSNELVSLDALAEELWDGLLPRAWRTTIRTHVYHLRKLLEVRDRTLTLAGRLATQASGYRFHVEPGELDCDVFTELVGRGRALLRSGEAEAASHVLRQALATWRGEPLADTPIGSVSAQYAVHLIELRKRALQLRIEADLVLGQHRELVPELRALVKADPLDEWLRARLIDALSRAGRRGDALAAFRDARTVLVRELGIEPCPELQQLQREILMSNAPGATTRLANVNSLPAKCCTSPN